MQAQYDTATHVKTPVGATPTEPSPQTPINSILNRFRNMGRKMGTEESGEYQHLDHKEGKHEVEVDDHMTLPPTEEYGALETVSMQSLCQLFSQLFYS